MLTRGTFGFFTCCKANSSGLMEKFIGLDKKKPTTLCKIQSTPLGKRTQKRCLQREINAKEMMQTVINNYGN